MSKFVNARSIVFPPIILLDTAVCTHGFPFDGYLVQPIMDANPSLVLYRRTCSLSLNREMRARFIWAIASSPFHDPATVESGSGLVMCENKNGATYLLPSLYHSRHIQHGLLSLF